MGLTLGKHARKTFVRGPIVGSLQYVNGEPALCLWRRNSANSELALRNDAAVVICLSSAYKYSGREREDKTFRREAAKEFARLMGFVPVAKSDVTAIEDVIEQRIDELVKMKPEPVEFMQRPPLDVRIRSDGVDFVAEEPIRKIIVPVGY